MTQVQNPRGLLVSRGFHFNLIFYGLLMLAIVAAAKPAKAGTTDIGTVAVTGLQPSQSAIVAFGWSGENRNTPAC